MNEMFGIVVDMKVAGGYIEYCRFFMDVGEQLAQDIFEQLLGLPGTHSDLLLRFSLVKFDNSPYEVLAFKYCKLDELGWNCRRITREVFKYYNLDK